ncbi:hypothetical protein FN846DRAFT_886510 [Sphaerosporella brunnea]|uniref:Uncharacterized protein n=1 Tax=Sphaerosporella brunnea TaxID=1250544 RepID=A0A5J5F9F3_9PEZI|nr:hypothetical protein FN846DRAFT_886510 [Sphaerosporella brunnea]
MNIKLCDCCDPRKRIAAILEKGWPFSSPRVPAAISNLATIGGSAHVSELKCFHDILIARAVGYDKAVYKLNSRRTWLKSHRRGHELWRQIFARYKEEWGVVEQREREWKECQDQAEMLLGRLGYPPPKHEPEDYDTEYEGESEVEEEA